MWVETGEWIETLGVDCMRRIFATIVALSGLVGMSPVQAGSIVVNTASGSLGGLMLTNEGISGNTATILIEQLSAAQSFLNNVNGTTVAPDPVEVGGPITLLVTSTATTGNYDLALSPAIYNAVFGTTVGAQGILAFNQKNGVAPPALQDFFSMSGLITGVIANTEPTYDFSRMVGGSMNFTITGTTFTGTDSFVGLFATPGAKVTASGSFSIAAVSEPASVMLMGCGVVFFAFMAFARRRK